MSSQSHIIGKQFLDLVFRNQRDAYARQDSLLNCFKQEVLPQMERMFDELVPPDKVLVLDRLDLDLGEIKEGEFEQVFLMKLEQSIRSQVADLPQALLKEEQTTSGEFQRKGMDIHSPQGRILQAWIYFIEHGHLPWWKKINTFREFIAEWELLIQHQQDLTSLTRVLISKPKALQRWLKQMPDAVILSWITYIKGDEARKIFLRWQEHFPDFHPARISVNQLKVLEFAWNEAIIFALLTSENTAEKDTNALVYLTKILPDKVQTEIQRKWQEESQDSLIQLHPLKKKFLKISQVRPEASIDRSLGEAAARAEDLSENLSARNEPELRAAVNQSIYEEGVYLNHAGFILLHPFLSAFFSQLHMTERDAFAESSDQERGVLLLQYLATGNREFPEFDLGLSKLLMGWPEEEPILGLFQPSEAEIAMSQELLSSVLEHWTALKNSSVEALREGFLMRPGKLSRRKGQLLLQIEPSGVDILLSQLPWGIGLVKTPWMEEMLEVEWA